jgi:hypothetical protein
VTRFLAAALLGAVLAAPAGAAAPRTVVVDLGGTRGYVQADPGSVLAGVALFVQAGLDRQAAGQSGVAALVAETVLHTPVDGVPLTDAVDARGASIEYAVTAQRVRFYLEGTGNSLCFPHGLTIPCCA